MGVLTGLSYRIAGSEFVLSRLRANIASAGITVLTYHDVGSDNDDIDAWQVVRQRDFIQQIGYLRDHYDVISLDEALSPDLQYLPARKPRVVLTFDDGHRGFMDYAMPVIQREQVPVTIYVATEHIESQRSYWFDRVVNHLQSLQPIDIDLTAQGLGRYRFNETHGPANWARIQALLVAIKSLPPDRCDAMADEVARQAPQRRASVLAPMSVADVAELANQPGVVIGAHSHGHEALTLLSPEAARASVTRSVELLAAWTGRTPTHFAYPSGFFSANLAVQIERLGFKSAVGAVPRLWVKTDSAFSIPRFSVGRYDSFSRFKVNAVRDPLALRWL